MTTATDLDTDLEALVNDEVPCEEPDHSRLHVECSAEVTHYFRALCHVEGLLICGNVAAMVADTLKHPRACGDCRTLIQGCWTIRPI